MVTMSGFFPIGVIQLNKKCHCEGCDSQNPDDDALSAIELSALYAAKLHTNPGISSRNDTIGPLTLIRTAGFILQLHVRSLFIQVIV
jgi:hypothetical protein